MDIPKHDAERTEKIAPALLSSRRRQSSLGSHLDACKLKDAQALSPSERLLTALRLSDICRELQRSCLPKP